MPPERTAVVPNGVARKFLRDRSALAALSAILLLVLTAIVVPMFWRYRFEQLSDDISQAPSWSHPMGTDTLGRDLFAQVLRGLQQSLAIAGSVTVLGVVLGVALGLVAGYSGGWADNVVMRLVDLTLTLPVLAIGAFFGSIVPPGGTSWLALSLVLALLMWVSVARLVRGVVLNLKELPYLQAAETMGAGRVRILVRHVLPNVSDHLIVAATLLFSGAIIAESSLSFLGFGVVPPDTSLGLLVAEGQSTIHSRPWLFFFPGGFIIALVLCANYLGEGLRRAMNPRSHISHLLPRGRRSRPATVAAPVEDGPLVAVRDLTVSFGQATPVAGVSFDIHRDETVALVGESGSGKTLTAHALIGMVPPPGVVGGNVVIDGRSCTGWSEREWAELRGTRIAMILQDPSTALNPVLSIGQQFAHSYEDGRANAREIRDRCARLLDLVSIADPERVLRQYPHELSGGMRQRVAIAMALAHDPELIIADEPTTALDVTVQAQVCATLLDVRERLGTSMLFISHNLGVVAGLADRVVVMKDGQVRESGTVADVFANPQDAYTQMLLRTVPTIPAGGAARG
ncbi:dipeptide/oligopeptide/nickel ABC transporter permease/ATP-binding protein [Amycolatopsis jejuensis]|uniref:dipeptide/oligopeptide/nickel ABC transporter permease/ATP-binding protein n=1 Tax=Amycolatopsis jejuensis TaxID=330084 RepID=UPI000689DF56|nr:dipeptide/oligopeptide/nickel ABC transporter permease/ATP-binding protein [Amycolatopsis jejuensis]